MNRDLSRQFVTAAATVLMLLVNILANALPLNGQSTGEISDRFKIYFVPAGYVFAIWGLIYIGLIAFTVYQALPSQRENPRLRRIGWLYVVSSGLNILWIFFWHFNVFLGTILVMLGLLAVLIAIYVLLGIGVVRVQTAEKWLVNVPYSIYLGWISVAAIANVSQFLFWRNWNGWGIGPQAWAIIMILVATFIGLLMVLLRRDIAYTLVLVWAFVGIGVKHLAEPAVAVIAVAWFAALLLILMIVFAAVRSFRPRSLSTA